MVRYRLDDLGWFQFESMVQSLLKAEFGVGVESWGGTNDFGRDAYCPGPLRFPDKKRDGDARSCFRLSLSRTLTPPARSRTIWSSTLCAMNAQGFVNACRRWPD